MQVAGRERRELRSCVNSFVPLNRYSLENKKLFKKNLLTIAQLIPISIATCLEALANHA